MFEIVFLRFVCSGERRLTTSPSTVLYPTLTPFILPTKADTVLVLVGSLGSVAVIDTGVSS